MNNTCSSPSPQEGILLINKAKGISSFNLVSRLRKRLGIKKIGHAGTLDPFATGVMVMLIGRNYTKLSDSFLSNNKEYIATIQLGQATDSYDCDGNVTFESDYVPSFDEVQQTIMSFQGKIEQIPPMFSAKKIGGKKLYELARKGIEIERPPQIVDVSIDILEYSYPFIIIKVACSKGTYIRSLGHDIGMKLTCGAHLINLERTYSGKFSLKDCVNTEMIDKHDFPIEQFLIKIA